MASSQRVDGSSAPENPEVGQTARAEADPSAPPQKETVETDGQILVDAVLGRFARRTLPIVEAPKVDCNAGLMPQAVEALAQMSNEALRRRGRHVTLCPRPDLPLRRCSAPLWDRCRQLVLYSFGLRRRRNPQ